MPFLQTNEFCPFSRQKGSTSRFEHQVYLIHVSLNLAHQIIKICPFYKYSRHEWKMKPFSYEYVGFSKNSLHHFQSSIYQAISVKSEPGVNPRMRNRGWGPSSTLSSSLPSSMVLKFLGELCVAEPPKLIRLKCANHPYQGNPG